jgi:hypothetical protein
MSDSNMESAERTGGAAVSVETPCDVTETAAAAAAVLFDGIGVADAEVNADMEWGGGGKWWCIVNDDDAGRRADREPAAAPVAAAAVATA